MAFDGELAVKAYTALFEGNLPGWEKMAGQLSLPDDGAGASILDLGAGPGEPSCFIAERFPKAVVTCTDLSADMVEKSKLRAEKKGVKLEHAVVNAADLSGYAEGSFDAVTMANSFQFVPPDEREKCLAEAKRVLKPGGKLLEIHWVQFDYVAVVAATFEKLLGAKPPPPPAGPMALSKPGSTESLVDAVGGLAKVEVSEFPCVFSIKDDMAKITFAIAPMQKLKEMEATKPGILEEYMEKCVVVAEELGFKTDDGYVAKGMAQLSVYAKA
jgi:SAM-dependent methyltransferase